MEILLNQLETRRQLKKTEGNFMFRTQPLSRTNQENIKEAMADSAWIESMQEELHQVRLGTSPTSNQQPRDLPKDTTLVRKSSPEVKMEILLEPTSNKLMGTVRFGKRGKLSPRYIGPFKILARVGLVAYTLELPEELKGIHSPFHVSNLKKCLAKGDIVVPMDEIQLDDKLHMIEEPVEVVDKEAAEEAVMASKPSDDDICVTSVLDKGKWIADKGKGMADKGKRIMVDDGKAGRKTAMTKNIGIVIGENVNPTTSEDDDTDSDLDMEQRFKGSADLEEMYKALSDSESEYSDKFVDYLSEGEDELISLRKRNKHEEYIDTLMHQLRGKGDGLTYPFTILENDQSNEKYLIHDDQTHWKMRKPKVGEKYVDVAQLKECLTYYSLANGYAKTKALNEGENTIQEHYAMIRSYGTEILDSNDGSTVNLGVTVNPDDKTYFDRFYCCFYGLKKGFQLGCRHVIALDGCFLKKPNVGEILTAVGRDGNNHVYPIAWAVVNVENKDSWSWFLELLGEDIDMPIGNGLTLISDQHKWLIEAVKDVMPLDEHIQYVRHIYGGFRKQYSGVKFMELFWATSKASYPQLFNKIMQKINRANPGAHEYLIKKDPKTWSRAFFRIGSNCEAIENGFSECFNSVLLLTGDICPNIQKRLELNKDKHRFWHVIPAEENLFEVRNGSEAFTADEHNRFCTCRMWKLADSSMYSTVLAPKPRTMSDRPMKHRIRAPHERQYPNRVSRAGVEMTCQNCFKKGHNKSSCTKPKVIPPKKQPPLRGRPKKNEANVESGGHATIDMDESMGVEADTSMCTVEVEDGTNLSSKGRGVDPTINVALMDGVSIECNERVRCANFVDFVSVRCKGSTSATPSRGRVVFNKGRATSVGLGVRRVTSEGTPVARTGSVGQTVGVRRGTSASTSFARGKGKGKG
ncbi:pentatricopeptide repeat-containing protein [Tanacetum coccineum]|uniref:Pentatricopeptide repeat-containing protein n=1 Tax=Tanacetum coccineum TaxID=301880 RepID=A0ABQ4ZSH3_9ASTR